MIVNRGSEKRLVLPPGWRWAKLGEVAEIFAGSAAPQEPRYFQSSGPLFIRVSDIGAGKRIRNLAICRDHLSPLAVSTLPLVKAKAGTLIFPKSGAAVSTNSRAILSADAYIVSHLMAIAPYDNLLSDWLFWWMSQIDMMDYSDNAGYPSLKKSVIEKIDVSLPPIAEQKRIAAILNEQMAAIDKACAASEAQLEAAEALSAAYLHQVFPKEGQELPFGWRWAKLGEICDSHIATRNPRETPDEKFIYVDISSIDNQYKRICGFKELLGKEAPSRARQVIKEKDVLVSTTRPGLNAVAIVPAKLDCQICSTGFCVLRAVPDILLPELLFFFVQSPHFVSSLADLVKGALYPAVSDNKVEEQYIPLPPQAEQKRIAAILNNQMTSAERLRTHLGKQIHEINAIPSALLKKAFNGEL